MKRVELKQWMDDTSRREYAKKVYGHMESMKDTRVTKVYSSEFEGRRRSGKPRRKWYEMVSECVRKQGMRKSRR